MAPTMFRGSDATAQVESVGFMDRDTVSAGDSVPVGSDHPALSVARADPDAPKRGAGPATTGGSRRSGSERCHTPY